MPALLKLVVGAAALMSVVVAVPASARAWELTIEAPASLASARARLEQADPGRLEQALQRAGLALPQEVRVALVAEDDERARATPGWIAGQAFHSGDIVLFPARVTSYPYDSLESVLWHEVVHVALGLHADGRPLPRWFHEGVAVSVETGWRVTDDLQLLLAAASGPAIADITRLFASASRPDTAEAYRLATALVDDLRRRHGAAVPGAIAARVAQGADFQRSFEMETGETPEHAAAQAWAAYRTVAVWLPVVTSRAAVWTLIVSLAFVAFVVRLRRRARRRRQWDEAGERSDAFIVFALLAALAGCGPGSASNVTLIAHDFDRSTDGWLVSGDTGMAAPGFQPDGGRSGGYIFGDDEAAGETWYFHAPDTVLSQLPAAEGGTLSYSLKQSSSEAGFVEDDIIIVGPAGRLSYRFGTAPGTGWTAFSVRLSASEDWRWNWNARATEEQIRSVLRNPSRLEIRGEYLTGPDVGGLDDFVLTAGG